MSQQLRSFAGLWTLREYPAPDSEWSLDEKFAAVKAAGFDGIGGMLIPETIPLCGKYGLDYILYINADPSNWEESLRQAVAYKPKRVNVHLMDHDTPPEDAVATWIDMVALAEQLGLHIDLEIHRLSGICGSSARALAGSRAGRCRPLRLPGERPPQQRLRAFLFPRCLARRHRHPRRTPQNLEPPDLCFLPTSRTRP